MNVPRAAGLSMAGAGALGVVVGVALPWSQTYGVYGDDAHFFRPRPDTWLIVVLVLLVAVSGAARAAWRRFEERTPSAVAALTSLLGGLFAVAGVDRVDPAAGVRVGAPLAMVGAFTAALGWIVVAANPRLPRPRLVVAGAVVVLLAADVAVVRWAVEGRFVDAGRGSAAAVPAPAGDLAGERWHRAGTSGRVLGVAGPQLLTTDHSGVRAYATRTGRPTWHYTRSDGNLEGAVLLDGTVVTLYGSSTDLITVTGHDAVTGEERFATSYERKTRNPVALVAAGHLAVLTDLGFAPLDLVAFDPRSGAVRWRYTPEGRCDLDAVTAFAGGVALARRCLGSELGEAVIGLSEADGRPRWTWRAPATSGQPLSVDAADGGLLVRSGPDPRTSVLLDAGGAAAALTGVPDGFRAASAGTAFFYDTTTEGGVATAVSLPGGARRWQVRLPDLPRWIVDGAALTDQRLYLLLSGPQSAALRVLALDRTTGAVLATHDLPCAGECPGVSIGADAYSVVVGAGGALVSLT